MTPCLMVQLSTTQPRKLKPEIDLAAQRQINYLDFWQRLAADNVKNKLFKDIGSIQSGKVSLSGVMVVLARALRPIQEQYRSLCANP